MDIDLPAEAVALRLLSDILEPQAPYSRFDHSNGLADHVGENRWVVRRIVPPQEGALLTQ